MNDNPTVHDQLVDALVSSTADDGDELMLSLAERFGDVSMQTFKAASEQAEKIIKDRMAQSEREISALQHYEPLFEGMPDGMGLEECARAKAANGDELAKEYLTAHAASLEAHDEVTSVGLMDQLIYRLRKIAEVIGAEHRWLNPQVEEARAEEKADVAAGYKDADLYDGSTTKLLMMSNQVDRHLENLERGAALASDIAESLENFFVKGKLIVPKTLVARQ